MKVSFYTLGCKVNHYETQAMLELFLKAGWEAVPFPEPADVYVVNTCTVTQISDGKSRRALLRAHRASPEAPVIAVGCYAQTHEAEVRDLPGISLVLGTSGRTKIVEYAEALLKNGGAKPGREETPCFEELSAVADSRTRATLKIQDGCRSFCSYCAIPYARGPLRSRSLDSIRRELEGLEEEGYREVVLTGIHLTDWGRDTGEGDLNGVLRTVCAGKSGPRIRLGSLEPRFCDEAFAETVAGAERLCPQFHLSLQSGCDTVLRRMNRHYTAAEYEKAVELLREASVLTAITTDVIAGFVGETEEEHEETLAFVRRIGFARTHVFPYSRRAGTRADAMEGHLPKAVKERRAKELAEAGDRMETEYVSAMRGKVLRVLEEQRAEGYSENYVRVRVENPLGQDTLYAAEIIGSDGKTAVGRRISDAL